LPAIHTLRDERKNETATAAPVSAPAKEHAMKKNIVFFLLTVIPLIGCGIPEEEHNAALQNIEKLTTDLDAATAANTKLSSDLDALRAENTTLKNRLEELGENVQKLLGEKGVLADDLAATREREERLRKEQAAQKERLAKYRQVIEKFQSLVTSGKLKIRIVRGRMVVEMASNILFPSGKAALHDEGQAALAELAAILRTIDARDFQVAGHTDNVPIKSRQFPSNWELSTARSVTVVKFLQSQGVNPTNLSAAGYAEYMPAADNVTEAGKSQNRRIEIILMPNLDELPDLSGLGMN
jgi:chemotaxis protein MotB